MEDHNLCSYCRINVKYDQRQTGDERESYNDLHVQYSSTCRTWWWWRVSVETMREVVMFWSNCHPSRRLRYMGRSRLAWQMMDDVRFKSRISSSQMQIHSSFTPFLSVPLAWQPTRLQRQQPSGCASTIAGKATVQDSETFDLVLNSVMPLAVTTVTGGMGISDSAECSPMMTFDQLSQFKTLSVAAGLSHPCLTSRKGKEESEMRPLILRVSR